MASASGNRSAASVRVCGSATSLGRCCAGEGERTEELVEVVHARGEREHDDVHDEERDWSDQPWFASRVGVDVPCAAIFFFPTEESMFE